MSGLRRPSIRLVPSKPDEFFVLADGEPLPWRISYGDGTAKIRPLSPSVAGLWLRAQAGGILGATIYLALIAIQVALVRPTTFLLLFFSATIVPTIVAMLKLIQVVKVRYPTFPVRATIVGLGGAYLGAMAIWLLRNEFESGLLSYAIAPAAVWGAGAIRSELSQASLEELLLLVGMVSMPTLPVFAIARSWSLRGWATMPIPKVKCIWATHGNRIFVRSMNGKLLSRANLPVGIVRTFPCEMGHSVAVLLVDGSVLVLETCSLAAIGRYAASRLTAEGQVCDIRPGPTDGSLSAAGVLDNKPALSEWSEAAGIGQTTLFDLPVITTSGSGQYVATDGQGTLASIGPHALYVAGHAGRVRKVLCPGKASGVDQPISVMFHNSTETFLVGCVLGSVMMVPVPETTKMSVMWESPTLRAFSTPGGFSSGLQEFTVAGTYLFGSAFDAVLGIAQSRPGALVWVSGRVSDLCEVDVSES